jgi:hypothetical protein
VVQARDVAALSIEIGKASRSATIKAGSVGAIRFRRTAINSTFATSKRHNAGT